MDLQYILSFVLLLSFILKSVSFQVLCTCYYTERELKAEDLDLSQDLFFVEMMYISN